MSGKSTIKFTGLTPLAIVCGAACLFVDAYFGAALCAAALVWDIEITMPKEEE